MPQLGEHGFPSLWDISSPQQSGVLQRLRNVPKHQQMQCRHFFPHFNVFSARTRLVQLRALQQRGVGGPWRASVPARQGRSQPSAGHPGLWAPGDAATVLGEARKGDDK